MSEGSEEMSRGPDRRASRLVMSAIVLVLIAGALAFTALREPPPPPPADIAGDGLLVEGRDIFLARCASCHGPSGRGDGPIAKGLDGPPPGNLTSPPWKHGDGPEQVFGVISRGVPGTSMSAWKDALGLRERRAVAAYVFHLAGRPVPSAYRVP